MEHVLNFKISPDDSRDFIFSSETTLNNSFPENLDLRENLMPV